MTLPFVSVVVPILNRRKWVQEALESLESQTYPRDRFEVIVVDNGSTDGTWEWVQEKVKSAPLQMRCYRNDAPEKVPAASRNFGIHKAQGEIVAFTDSDCRATPEWLREGVKAFAEGVGIVEGKTVPVPTDAAPALCRVKIIDGSRSYFDTANIMYRKHVLEEVGGFAKDFYLNGYPRFYGEDLDLGYRVKSKGYRVCFAENAIVLHHNHPQTFWQWLREPRLVFICPYIARKHPNTRSELLFAKYFLSRSTAAFDLGLLASVLALAIHPFFLVGWVPFLLVKMREQGSGGNWLERFLRLGGGLVRSFITLGVLVAGSFRYRSLIL